MIIEQQISVRDLVSHVLTSGDLGFGFSGAGRLLQAIRAHQKVQNQRPEGYMPEVVVSHTVENSNIRLVINGRVDGLWPLEDGLRVEEIKTTTRSLQKVAEEKNPIHWGQLQCYAYMVAHEKNLETISGQLTYYHLDTGDTQEIVRLFEFDTMTVFFNDLVSRYLDWLETIITWRLKRNQSIQTNQFPYPAYRTGQRDMAVAVYRTIRDSATLMAQAATGIGKTIAVLFPAIKAMGESMTEAIFYLTARTTGQKAAEKALKQLQAQGLAIKYLIITAKDKICFEPEAGCNPELCRFAKGYYDRCRAGIGAAFNSQALTRDKIEKIAMEHTICPFTLSLALAESVDVIIGDYNYAFDPRVALKSLIEEKKDQVTFLVDEAHNLVDRSRQMYSARLTKEPFLAVRRQLKTALPHLHQIMGRINHWFLATRKTVKDGLDHHIDPSVPDKIISLLYKFIHQADQWLNKNEPATFREALLERYFETIHFLHTTEIFDDHYVSCFETGKKDSRITLFCLDPSTRLAERLKKSRATVFFSATLAPMKYFNRLFGIGNDTRYLTIPSPFPPQHRQVVICPHISTRYRTRKKTLPDVVAAIQTILAGRPGNYLFFFPSHLYLQDVYAVFEQTGLGGKIIRQTPQMADNERKKFLAHFDDSAQTRVAFAVLGGIFGEGIDLIGNRLNGVAIIGVGLPAISWQNDLIREYFKQKTGRGYEYAYAYPGINRVLQAAGRVIRSEIDTGVIFLIDDRFNTVFYRQLLPLDWQPVKAFSSADIKKQLKNFNNMPL